MCQICFSLSFVSKIPKREKKSHAGLDPGSRIFGRNDKLKHIGHIFLRTKSKKPSLETLIPFFDILQRLIR